MRFADPVYLTMFCLQLSLGARSRGSGEEQDHLGKLIVTFGL